MMSKQLLRLISTLVIAGAWLAVACASTLPPADEKAFLAYLKSAQIPVAGITVTNQCVSVNISEDIEGPAAKQVAKSVFTGICKYAPGYRFTLQYPKLTRSTQMAAIASLL